MTEDQAKHLQQMENYARLQREKHFYDIPAELRTPANIEMKEILTNILAWCLLIKNE